MRWPNCVVPAVAFFALSVAFASIAHGQGYYDRNVQRNPITGRLEVVPSTGGYGQAVGPNRNYSDFYGGRFNPYSGTAAQSRVQRDPVTGRLNVDNQYYNPWTGARVETATRYNPLTRRYETIQLVTPPNRPLPSDAPAEIPPTDQSRERTRPRVIETTPPPSTLPLPPDGQ